MPRMNCKTLSAGSWTAIAVAILAATMSGESRGDGAVAPVHVETHGEAATAAPTVIFIPGLGTPGEVWTGTADALGDRVDARLVTLAGFGGLPTTGEDAVIEPSVEALAGWIEANTEGEIDLVGHSLGGQIALLLAARLPDRIDDVVVVDSAPFYARLFNPAATPDQAAGFGAMMRQQMAAAPREAYLAQIRQGLPAQATAEADQARVMGWMEVSDQATVATAFGEVAGTDFSAAHDGIVADVHVLVAWSDAAPVDAATIGQMYRDQYAGLPGANIGIVEDSRHFIMLDQPGAFVARLETHLLDEEAAQ